MMKIKAINKNVRGYIVALASILLLGIPLLIFTNFSDDKFQSEDEIVSQDSVQVYNARLVFVGDLMQHMPQVNAAKQSAGDYDYWESFQYLKPYFDDADLSFVNLETTLNNAGKYTGYPLFRSPPQVADGLKKLGANVVVLANNHICDNGRKGLDFTIQYLDSLNILSTGAFADSLQYKQKHPLYLDAKGIRLALLNYTYGTNGMPIPANCYVNLADTAKILKDIKEIDRSTTDGIIVFFHWGDEYSRRANSEQRLLSELCHKNGVEMVIGSHPHVVQPIETKIDADSIVRAITVYSLGNLVSNQRDRYRDGGILVSLDIHKTDTTPLQIVPYYTPIWVSLPKYKIVPQSVADTLNFRSDIRTNCKTFFEDTRKLLGTNPFVKEKM